MMFTLTGAMALNGKMAVTGFATIEYLNIKHSTRQTGMDCLILN
jgi:hypothetical protein